LLKADDADVANSAGMERAAFAGIRVRDLADKRSLWEPALGDLGRRGHSHRAPAATRCPARISPMRLEHQQKAITLDLRSPDWAAPVRLPGAKSDVVIETFAPGTLSAWGIGYETMKEAQSRNHPDLGDALRSDRTLRKIPRHRSHSVGGWRALVARRLSGDRTGGRRGRQGYLGRPSSAPSPPSRRSWSARGTNHGNGSTSPVRNASPSRSKTPSRNGILSGHNPPAHRDQATRGRHRRLSVSGRLYQHCGGAARHPKAFKTLVGWIRESGAPGSDELLDQCWQDFKFRQSPEGISRFAEISPGFAPRAAKQELYGKARRADATRPSMRWPTSSNDPQLRAAGLFPRPA